jgi:hypothetical protein
MPWRTVLAMTPDVSRRRMPGTVMTAAILLGLLGGIFGLAMLMLGLVRESDGVPFIAAGLLVVVVTAVAVIGMAKASIAGQIITIGFGGLMVAGGLYMLGQGTIAALLWLAVGATSVVLVLAPISSRDWFSGR